MQVEFDIDKFIAEIKTSKYDFMKKHVAIKILESIPELENNTKVQEEFVNLGPHNIDLFSNPSQIVQRMAVSMSGGCIEYIKNPSERVCKVAVKKAPSSIRFIKNPSYEVQQIVFKERGIGYLKKYVKSKELALEFDLIML